MQSECQVLYSKITHNRLFCKVKGVLYYPTATLIQFGFQPFCNNAQKWRGGKKKQHNTKKPKHQTFWYKRIHKTQPKRKTQKPEILPYISSITKCSVAGLYPRKLSIHSHEIKGGISLWCAETSIKTGYHWLNWSKRTARIAWMFCKANQLSPFIHNPHVQPFPIPIISFWQHFVEGKANQKL